MIFKYYRKVILTQNKDKNNYYMIIIEDYRKHFLKDKHHNYAM